MAEKETQASAGGGTGSKPVQHPGGTSNSVRLIGLAIVAILLFLFFVIIPPNEILTKQALYYTGIFLAFLASVLFNCCDMSVSGAIACMLLVVTKCYTINVILANGFGSSTVWFIAFAYIMTAAVNKTGVLKRLVFKLFTFFPETWASQVTALMISGFIINPFIPSGQAKITVIAPMTEIVAKRYGFEQHSKGAVGLFMGCWPQVSFQTMAWATSTGYVITAGLSGESYNFVNWFGISGVWLIVMTVGWLLYTLNAFKPDGNTKYEKGSSKKFYNELGPMTKDEKKGLFVLLVTVALWIVGPRIGIDNTTASMIGFALAFLFGLMNSRELPNAVPWSLILSIMFLMPIFAGIREFKISDFIIETLKPMTAFISNPFLIILAICIIVYLIRQLVVDVMSSCIICSALFGGIAVSMGIPLAAVTFAAFTCTSIYNIKALSIPWLMADGASRGWISFDDIKKTAWPYALLNTIALLASIPVWLMLK